MDKLSGNQRRWLAKQANRLKPIAQLGKNGLTPEFIASIDKTLEAHELIKLRFLNFKEEKDSIAQELAKETSGQVVRITGNVALIYRPRKKKDERIYKLPAPK